MCANGPQQPPKTSTFYSRSKKRDIKKALGGGYPPLVAPLGSPKVNEPVEEPRKHRLLELQCTLNTSICFVKGGLAKDFN